MNTPEGPGWIPWLYSGGPRSPYDYVEVEVWREGWKESALQAPDANPHGNAVGLWWRAAGPLRAKR